MSTEFSFFEQSLQYLLHQHPEIISELERKLRMRYTPGQEPEGNLCLANDEALRPEFKNSFTFADVVNYLFGYISSSSLSENERRELFNNFPYPENPESFWRLVNEGKELKSKN